MTEFIDLDLAKPILKAVEQEGYTEPTPIQAKVIPELLNGHDVVGIAQTGTGKTAAFVLPLLNVIAAEKKRPNPKHCYALVLAPTRELAQQIVDSVKTYGKHMRHSVALVVGGVKPFPQIRALSRGVDIVVATPGRLLDHLGTGHITLGATSCVVLDEADQMLDMGFIPAIREVLAALPDQRQTVLLSATMPKPIRKLASDFLDQPKEVSVAPASKPIERIDQKVHLVDKPAKGKKLVELLSEPGVDRTIVFARTKHGADKIQRQLVKAGFEAEAIHGNKSQGQRLRALKAFKTGESNVLVATDIAARGIDIDGVSHVVNFDLPNVAESYVHRIGRTARAGATGIAHSLVDPAERMLLRDIERLIGYNLIDDGFGPNRKPGAKSDKSRRRGGKSPGFKAKTPFLGRGRLDQASHDDDHFAGDYEGDLAPTEFAPKPKSKPKSKPTWKAKSGKKPFQKAKGKSDGKQQGKPQGRPEGKKSAKPQGRHDLQSDAGQHRQADSKGQHKSDKTKRNTAKPKSNRPKHSKPRNNGARGGKPGGGQSPRKRVA